MANNLEAYLAIVEAQLTDIPATSCTPYLDEVRAHLHAMCEAKRADGLDAESAWQQAAAEFGEPERVGRDLRAQWANSAQLETEGEPLTLRRKVRMFALPLAACVAFYALFSWIQAPQNAVSWRWPAIAIFVFGCLAYGTASNVRARGGWKPSTLVGCAGAIVIVSNSLLNLSGHPIGNGAWRDWGIAVFILYYNALYLWLRKGEKSQRPWQYSALYKTSPIAAEQTYRLAPIVGLAMGTTMGCIGMLSMGSQFFGWPVAIFGCAVSVGAAVIIGKWRLK